MTPKNGQICRMVSRTLKRETIKAWNCKAKLVARNVCFQALYIKQENIVIEECEAKMVARDVVFNVYL